MSVSAIVSLLNRNSGRNPWSLPRGLVIYIELCAVYPQEFNRASETKIRPNNFLFAAVNFFLDKGPAININGFYLYYWSDQKRERGVILPQFEKVAQGKFKSKGSIIAEQLFGRIKSGEYAVGSKLPAERIIAEQMEVSRPSVREAISALQIVGVLESRPGDGTYITEPLAMDELMLQVQRFFEESDSPYEILQARKAVEIGVVRLAVSIGTDEDIRQIKIAWDEKYKLGRKGEYDAYIRYGRDLHLAIAKATKNRITEAMMDRLLNVTNQPLWKNMRRAYYEQDPARIEQMLEIHNDIVKAIQDRDAEKATKALEADFDAVLEQLYSIKSDKSEMLVDKSSG